MLFMKQAIQQNSLFPPNPNFPVPAPLVVGDVNQGFANSAHVITGMLLI